MLKRSFPLMQSDRGQLKQCSYRAQEMKRSTHSIKGLFSFGGGSSRAFHGEDPRAVVPSFDLAALEAPGHGTLSTGMESS